MTGAAQDVIAGAAIPALSRSAHDRAGLLRRDERWLAGAWPAGRVLVLSTEGTTPVVRSGRGPALAWRSADQVDAGADRLFLGQLDGVAYFAVGGRPPVDARSTDGASAGGAPAVSAGGEEWEGLRALGGELADLDAGLLTAAVALSEWHRRHTHCPACGAATAVIEGGWARRCPVDDSQHFPRTDPAVIMLIHDGADRCVLGRQAAWPPGRYSILAGFVEAGEAAEAAVVREVYEEVGLRVTDIEYRSSQPWPFPASLMLGFTARAVGDLTLTRHDDELADAGWFTRAELRRAATWDDDRPAPSDSPLAALPGGISIARHLLDAWLDG